MDSSVRAEAALEVAAARDLPESASRNLSELPFGPALSTAAAAAARNFESSTARAQKRAAPVPPPSLEKKIRIQRDRDTSVHAQRILAQRANNAADASLAVASSNPTMSSEVSNISSSSRTEIGMLNLGGASHIVARVPSLVRGWRAVGRGRGNKRSRS